MLNWFYYLPFDDAMAICISLVLINFLISYLRAVFLKRDFLKSGSAELTLKKYALVNRIYSLLLLIMFIFFFIIIYYQLYWVYWEFDISSGLLKLVSLLYTFFLIEFILAANRMITFNTGKLIKGDSRTRIMALKELNRGLLTLFIPVAAILSLSILLGAFFEQFFSKGTTSILVSVSLILIIYVTVPHFFKFLLKSKPMPDTKLKSQLQDLLDRAQVSNVRLYQYSAAKKRANAFVTGLITKRIYISEYLLEEFSEEEAKSILAHEIGHIKGSHIRIRFIISMTILMLSAGFAKLLEWYYSVYYVQHYPYIVPFQAGVAIFYILLIALCLLLFMTARIQERQADAYPLELGIDYRIFTSSLLKIARLNHMKIKKNRLKDTFSTHPSFSRRVNWIIKNAHGSHEELKEYQTEMEN